ncbi:hypothetical protein [Photobacterium leiognathi]|uniref:hypothetical protein n=1 Tax=Photobacterium leiognathi TaxID=553611 RepID=UPI002735DB1F|nr:hypothetical protein [Photobacterium leiognathi]
MKLPSLKKSGDKSPIRKIKTLVTGVLAATLSFGQQQRQQVRQSLKLLLSYLL